MGSSKNKRKDRKRDRKGRYAEEPVRIPDPPKPSIMGKDKLLFAFGEDISAYGDQAEKIPSYDAMSEYYKSQVVSSASTFPKENNEYYSSVNWLEELDHSTDASGIPCYCPACDPSDSDSKPLKQAVSKYRASQRRIWGPDYDSDGWDG